jgi:hypothetical protein
LALHRNLRPELTILHTNMLLTCVKTNVRDFKISLHDRNHTSVRVVTYSLIGYSLINLNSYFYLST